MITKLNNILLGLLLAVLVIGVMVIVKGADNMSASFKYFTLGVLAMAFLSFIIVTWLISCVTKKRRERK
nr:MAG TPA: Cysteine and tyrosine-rich protein 1 [Caudoviricetes sp.]